MKGKWGIFLAATGLILGFAPRAFATYPVVPEGYGAALYGTSCPAGAFGSGCETYSAGGVNAVPPLAGKSSDGAASSSITVPAAGLPDLSVSASNPSGQSSSSTAYYWNTITFAYTGTGPAPATLSSQVSWKVNAVLSVPASAGPYDFTGFSSIEVSLSTCSCPLQNVSDTISSTGTYSLVNPFTIVNGGSIRYETFLSASASNSSGLAGSVFLDPQVSIDLPSGWTGVLASGGTLDAPGISATPESPSLLLFGTALSLLLGQGLLKRSGKTGASGIPGVS